MRLIQTREGRKNWREQWLSSIQEISDLEFQKIAWLDGSNTNPHFSFVEYFCCYFDDLGLADGYGDAIGEGLVSSEEFAAVEEYHLIADKYKSPSNDYDHQAILTDPSWLEVVAAARTAQKRLAELIVDAEERRILLEAPDWRFYRAHL